MLTRHLNKRQINAYLDGTLPRTQQDRIGQHLHACDRCYTRLQSEKYLRLDLKHELGAQGRLRRDDLAALLPNIMTEVRQPVRQKFSRLAIVISSLMIIMILMPMLPVFEIASFAAEQPLLNVPVATETLTPLEEETQVANLLYQAEISSANTLHNTFNMKYASPAPLPHATEAASLEPHNLSGNQ